MPELPEVETTRRHLAPVLEGATIVGATVRRQRMVRYHEQPGDFVDRIHGRTVESLHRVGKLLMARLDGDLTWITHLGMSGRMALHTPEEPEVAHTNVIVALDVGIEVRMVDPRTFGFVGVFTAEEMAEGYASEWGPDALDDLPTTQHLVDHLARRTAPIKALLLDQRLVAGLGNIYADEILFRARLRPDRPGRSLTAEEVARLRGAVRPVLRAGLRYGGTSLADMAYLLPDGRAGRYMARLYAYGREGLPCRRCHGVIERSVIRGRSSFWCPGCQA